MREAKAAVSPRVHDSQIVQMGCMLFLQPGRRKGCWLILLPVLIGSYRLVQRSLDDQAGVEPLNMA